MAKDHSAQLENFLEYTASSRALARSSTYTALAAIFVGIAVLAWDLVGTAVAYAMAVLLGGGALCVFATANSLHRLANLAEKRAREEQKTLTSSEPILMT